MDRRDTAANGRVALAALRGQVDSESWVEGTPMRVTAPLVDLCAAPDGARDRQMIHGDRVRVLETRAGWAFLRRDKDGYCGYAASAALGPDHATTHWVATPGTHLYPTPSLKTRESLWLTLGAELAIRPGSDRFAETAGGLFVPRNHLRRLDDRPTDPAAIAELFLGTPYLWGGNSRAGIDCSGLVQAALLACGLPCPGDSDQQWTRLGTPLPQGARLRRNDLLFWKGHVALALDPDHLIHANGAAAAVSVEPIAACLARIRATEGDTFLGLKRL